MKITECKNVRANGSISMKPFGRMPLFEMTSDPLSREPKTKLENTLSDERKPSQERRRARE